MEWNGAYEYRDGNGNQDSSTTQSSSAEGYSHLYSASSSSDQKIHPESTTTLTYYAKAKLRAEQSGQLEHFKNLNYARVAKQRRLQTVEEKKAISKKLYARRKARLEALRMVDPVEAQRVQEERKEKLRQSGRKYYHTHVGSERARSREKNARLKCGDKQGYQEDESTSTSRVIHDFDLNDPASCEEEEGDDGLE